MQRSSPSWGSGRGFKARLSYGPTLASSELFATLINPPEKKEREGYYNSLPSESPIVARSSSELWEPALGPDSRPEPKQPKNIGNHLLTSLLASIKDEVMKILDTYPVLQTTIKAFRFGYEGQKDMPVDLWIGTLAEGLIGRDGASHPVPDMVVMACKQLLEKNQILDVHCELKLSEAYRGTGPAQVNQSIYSNPVVDVEVHLTSTIGTCIARADPPNEGSEKGS